MPNYDKILWSRINKIPNGCWEWTGPTNEKTYGRLTIHDPVKKTVFVHRFVYELLIGPVPHGKELDHRCKNRRCCNPDHLEPVTHQENVRRAWTAQKTHCIRGHEFNQANTRIAPDGSRECRACDTLRRYERELRIHGRIPTPRKDRTSCPQGHPYPENKVYANNNVYCRICAQERARRIHRTKVGIPVDAPLQRRASDASTCMNGHDLTPENTYVRPSGVRVCRICKREQLREWRQRRT